MRKAPGAANLLWILILSTTRTLADWQALPPLPEPDGFFASGVVDGNIVVVGGSNWRDGTKHWLDVIWNFDLGAREWKPHGTMPHALAYPICCTWKKDLIIAGGLERKKPHDEIWRINALKGPVQIGVLSNPGTLGAAGMIGDELYVFGGCSDPAEITGMHAGGVRLNLNKGTSSLLRSPEDQAFCLAAVAVANGELLVFGGAHPDPATVYKSTAAAWAFAADKNAWRRLRDFPMPVRGASAVRLDKHRILVGAGYGGEPEDFLKRAFIYDLRANTYTPTLDFPVPALIGGLLCHREMVYCLGGEDKNHRTAACFSIRVKDLLDRAQSR